MAGRKLASAVHIDGTWYRAGDTLPEDVAAKVRNPKVFAPEDGEQADQPRSEPGTPAGARLAGRVQVGGKWYGPDDAVPDDVAAQITNPKAWEGGKVPSAPDAASTAQGDDQGDGGDGGKAKGPAADRLESDQRPDAVRSTVSGDGSVDGEDDSAGKPRRTRRT